LCLDARLLEGVMKNKILFSVCVALLVTSASAVYARDEQNKTYRCRARDAVSITQDGTLDKAIGKVALKAFDQVVFDIPSGHITFPATGENKVWTVEKTTVDNDYVLFPLKRSVADGVTTFIRLHLAPNEKPRFMAFTLSYLVAGTCDLE
jgi:hypothetical protein